VHKTFPDERVFAWQSGYGAFSVSESNAPSVVRYIKSQVEHHKRLTFEEELAVLLRKHGIDLVNRRGQG